MAFLLEQEIKMGLTTAMKHLNYNLMNCVIAEWQQFVSFSKRDKSSA